MQQARFISIEDIRLAYYVRNPDEKNTIFLIHGNSSSSRIWEAQLSSAALSAWRLIALDLPAHGLSDPFPDYSMPALGRLLAAAIKELSADSPCIIAGLSLGANVLAEMLQYDLKPAGLVLISSCAIGNLSDLELIFKPGIDIHAAFTDQVSLEELQQYWRTGGVKDPDGEKFTQFAEDYHAVKDNFRSGMFASVQAGKISDEIALLQQSALPLLAIFGEEDGVCNTDFLDHKGLMLWHNKVFKLPEAGHFANLDQPEDTCRLLERYATDVFK